VFEVIVTAGCVNCSCASEVYRKRQNCSCPHHGGILGERKYSFTDFLDLCRLRLKCDGTRAETRFCLSTKQTSPLKSAGASVWLTVGSRGVRIRGSNAGYTMF
jgi:hypothetical protein